MCPYLRTCRLVPDMVVSMSKQDWSLKYPSWQPQVLAALIEPDLVKLTRKVAAAEEAIFRRGLELTSEDDAERAAMRDASRQLRALAVTVLGYPAANTESDERRS